MSRIGLNSRLDTIQAAILIEKLKIFDDEIEKRNAVARRYNEAFAASNRIKTPYVIAGAVSTWAQYTLQVADRAGLPGGPEGEGRARPRSITRSRCRASRPMPHYPGAPTPVSEALSGHVVSLPMHPYLDAGHPGPRSSQAVLAAAG